jgi:hypothetical protein
MVDTGEKIETIIREYIEPGEYFVINRARQYGKTTTRFIEFTVFVLSDKMWREKFKEHKFSIVNAELGDKRRFKWYMKVFLLLKSYYFRSIYIMKKDGESENSKYDAWDIQIGVAIIQQTA